jgi:hypothetical protein
MMERMWLEAADLLAVSVDTVSVSGVGASIAETGISVVGISKSGVSVTSIDSGPVTVSVSSVVSRGISFGFWGSFGISGALADKVVVTVSSGVSGIRVSSISVGVSSVWLVSSGVSSGVSEGSVSVCGGNSGNWGNSGNSGNWGSDGGGVGSGGVSQTVSVSVQTVVSIGRSIVERWVSFGLGLSLWLSIGRSLAEVTSVSQTISVSSSISVSQTVSTAVSTISVSAVCGVSYKKKIQNLFNVMLVLP